MKILTIGLCVLLIGCCPHPISEVYPIQWEMANLECSTKGGLQKITAASKSKLIRRVGQAYIADQEQTLSVTAKCNNGTSITIQFKHKMEQS